MEPFLADMLESKMLDIQKPVCDLTAVFKDIKILKSETSSSTIQVVATFKANAKKAHKIIKEYVDRTGEENVFLKIGFDEDNDNSADIEQMIYKYLKKLLFDHRTPNIMRHVAGFKCDNFLTSLNEMILTSKHNRKYLVEMRQRVEELGIREQELGINVEKATITLVELGKGKSFDKILGEGTLTVEQFKSIMFQTFFTLRELYLNKIRHNDIHLGNIWVNILPQPRKLIYFVNDDMYITLETNYIVKIYDFDRSAFTMGPYSNDILRLQFCPTFGMCENENERFDLLIVASQLYQNWLGTYGFISDFVLGAVVQNPEYLEESCCEFPGRYCSKVADPSEHRFRCSADAKIETNGVYNIQQICEETAYFDEYMSFVSTDGYKKVDLPSKTILKNTDVPLYAFENDVYISSSCSLTPIQMANRLLRQAV